MDAVIDRLTAGVDPRPHLDARLQPRNRARNSRSCATDSRSTPGRIADTVRTRVRGPVRKPALNL